MINGIYVFSPNSNPSIMFHRYMIFKCLSHVVVVVLKLLLLLLEKEQRV